MTEQKSLAGFEASVRAAVERKRPFIAYAWRPNMFRSGQQGQGYLVVSLGEAEVPRVLTKKQEEQAAMGKKFSKTVQITVKPDRYDKDILVLRRQGRLTRLIRGDDEGCVVEDEVCL